MSLNAILWTVSYPEVRDAHSREESEELINITLDIIDQCAERWPGTADASQLYAILSRACLQGYDAKERPEQPRTNNPFSSPSTATDVYSPPSEASTPASVSTVISSQQQQQPTPTPPQQYAQQAPPFDPPRFNHVFNSTPDQMSTFDTNASNPFQNSHPTFRSNSIFFHPATDTGGRRFSYLPPESTLAQDPSSKPCHDSSLGAAPRQYNSQNPSSMSRPQQTAPFTPITSHMPTPPETLTSASTDPGPGSAVSTPMIGFGDSSPTPTLPYTSPVSHSDHQSPIPNLKYEFDQPPGRAHHGGQLPHPPRTQPPRPAAFAVHPPQPDPVRQRPLPPSTATTDWFTPSAPFASSYAFPPPSGNPTSDTLEDSFWVDGVGNLDAAAPFSGLGLGGAGGYAPLAGGGTSRDAGNAFQSATPSAQQLQPGGAIADGTYGPYGGGLLPQYGGGVFPPERQGSLSVAQQAELMGVLETDGMGEIDAFLNPRMPVDENGGLGPYM